MPSPSRLGRPPLVAHPAAGETSSSVAAAIA
jgi:hypothetical protein